MTISAIRRQIWNGKIPVRVIVDEPISIGRQEYLVSASRISYLWLYLGKILAYFNKYLDDDARENPEANSWWLEFNDQPLPFHWPIGLLHDLIVGYPTKESWDLVLKRGTFPSTIIPLNDTDSTIQSLWMNCLKESCYIRNGNSRAVMLLSMRDQETLWTSIEGATDYRRDTSDTFWQYASPLFRRNSASDTKIPLRFYFYKENKFTIVQHDLLSGHTLGDAIRATLGKLDLQESDNSLTPLLHGIAINETVKLDQVYSLCCYADGFLHIALNSA